MIKKTKVISLICSLMLVVGANTSALAVGQAENQTVIKQNDSFSQGVVRETTKGKIKGIVTNTGKSLAWLGVPYAKPPIGELRWRAPQEMDPWKGVRNATEEAPVSIQARGGISGSEDSLYLNVFRPNNNKKDLPVLFHIHGGITNLEAVRKGMEGSLPQTRMSLSYPSPTVSGL